MKVAYAKMQDDTPYIIMKALWPTNAYKVRNEVSKPRHAMARLILGTFLQIIRQFKICACDMNIQDSS